MATTKTAYTELLQTQKQHLYPSTVRRCTLRFKIPAWIPGMHQHGDSGRGNAIRTKQGIQLQDIERLPPGCAVASDLQSYRIVNVYAPSGHNRRQKRHSFFEEDIVCLLRKSPRNITLAGDLNSLQENADCTGEIQSCNAVGSLLEKSKSVGHLYISKPQTHIHTCNS
jgi:exonuclease III